MKTHPKNTVTEIYTHYGLKITWKMSGITWYGKALVLPKFK
jgi:hypothetical protein